MIGGEVLSRIVDWTDRNTCVLFGDAAGAAIVQATDEVKGILASYCGSDGDYSDTDLLGVPAGGSRMPATCDTVNQKLHTIKMRGREVFKLGVRIMPEAAQHVLALAGMTIDDVDLFIPHQANIRIIEAVGDRLGIPHEKVYINVDKYGNTSAADHNRCARRSDSRKASQCRRHHSHGNIRRRTDMGKHIDNTLNHLKQLMCILNRSGFKCTSTHARIRIDCL